MSETRNKLRKKNLKNDIDWERKKLSKGVKTSREMRTKITCLPGKYRRNYQRTNYRNKNNNRNNNNSGNRHHRSV